MITLLADKNIPFLTELLPDGVILKLFDPNSEFSGHDADVNALIVRTVTPIKSGLFNLKNFPNLTFVGSASAGYDHIDTAYLEKNGVSFFHAAGCNSNAVAEYVTTGILDWVQTKNLHPENLTVGIVGAGHTGSATGELLESVGFKLLFNDPPREAADPSFRSVDKAAILTADVISFHVPLNGIDDPYPTLHWLDADSVNKMNAHLIVNASRGGVVDEMSLVDAKSKRSELEFILDVWENEPRFNPATLESCYLGTPHIAGYSIQAKMNGTSMVMNALSRHFHLYQKNIHNPESSTWSPSGEFSIASGIRTLHPMFELSERLKAGVVGSEKNNIALFRHLRSHTSLRDEYRNLDPIDSVRNSPLRMLFKGMVL